MEDPILLRVPKDLARSLREVIDGNSNDSIQIVRKDDDCSVSIEVGSKSYDGIMTYLPTYVDASIRSDDLYVKGGDLSHAIVIGSEAELKKKLRRDVTPGSDLEILNSGLTEPTRAIVDKLHLSNWSHIDQFSQDEIAEAERLLIEFRANMKPRFESLVEEIVDSEPYMLSWFKDGDRDFTNITLMYENGILEDVFQAKDNHVVRRAPKKVVAAPSVAEPAPNPVETPSVDTSQVAPSPPPTASVSITESDIQAMQQEKTLTDLFNSYNEDEAVVGDDNDDGGDEDMNEDSNDEDNEDENEEENEPSAVTFDSAPTFHPPSIVDSNRSGDKDDAMDKLDGLDEDMASDDEKFFEDDDDLFEDEKDEEQIKEEIAEAKAKIAILDEHIAAVDIEFTKQKLTDQKNKLLATISSLEEKLAG